MKINEVVSLANEAPGDFSEKEVIKFFKSANVGHWPSEKSRITLSMDDGDVKVLATPKNISVEGHDITPAGRIWLLSQFFKTFPPQSLNIIDELSEVEGDPASYKAFIREMRNRLNGKCQLIRMKDKRIGFSESRVINQDGSSVFVYETTDLDVDGQERMTVMVPGNKPVIYVYLVENFQVVRFKVRYEGHQIEALPGWERAAMSTEWTTEIFPTELVTEPMMNKLFDIVTTEASEDLFLSNSKSLKSRSVTHP